MFHEETSSILNFELCELQELKTKQTYSKMTKKNKAVVLLSGGLDSTTCVAIAQDQGFDIYGLSFDYGQRHTIELDAAARVAQKMGLKKHVTATRDLIARRQPTPILTPTSFW